MATSKTPKFDFKGGPLDGQSRNKHNVGRWAKFLDNQGEAMLTRTHDRMVSFGSTDFYELDDRATFDNTGTEIRTYTHGSAK